MSTHVTATQRTLFHPAGWEVRHLDKMFAVEPGYEASDAIDMANCCASSVQALASQAVINGDMDADIAFACQVLSAIAQACLGSIQTSAMGDES